MSEESASEQIDGIIKLNAGWKGDLIKHLRTVINDANPNITEEIKWKMKTRPEGLPVWTSNGIVCFVEIWKDNVKLIFFKGSSLPDPSKLFNSRLKSSTVRAIEFHEGDPIDKPGIKGLVINAVELNASK